MYQVQATKLRSATDIYINHRDIYIVYQKNKTSATARAGKGLDPDPDAVQDR
jgi:hypothetical protein